MKQILQNLKNGDIDVAEIPVPKVKMGHVLIRTTITLISLGTEKMLLDFGKSNYIDKARKQPDKVKQVINKVKTDGLSSTVETVLNKLDTPLPMGYSSVGVVEEVGSGITHFKKGDRVVSNGPHAEYVLSPENLTCKIPDSVKDESAAFTITSSIGLQGIRLLKPTLGENIVVIGMGLIGLLSVQILKANGCNVIGVDIDDKKLEIAKSYGITCINSSKNTNLEKEILELTQNQLADGVLITAATTSNEILHQAATISRKRGRIVLVGVIGDKWSRADFYKKELSFQVSCSYGPGRYDPIYENGGLDYPLAYVRWTQNRNFDAVLKLMESKQVNTDQLISEVIPIEQANEFYGNILNNPELIGVLLKYPEKTPIVRSVHLNQKQNSPLKAPISCGVIGAGNFTKSTLLPAIAKLKMGSEFHFNTICSSTGASANHLAKKFKFTTVTTDSSNVLNSDNINTVLITTPHNSHAKLTIEALKAKKHVFVEKPLCLNHGELEQVKSAYTNASTQLMLGFNRRFSPHIQKMKELTKNQNTPKSILIHINAGFIPNDHWLHDHKSGGGRLVGEGIHFIDLARYLVGHPINSINTVFMDDASQCKDSFTISLEFKDGSIASINYWSNGNKTFPKERVQIFSQEKILDMNNFRELTGYGYPGFKRFKTSRQEKGHKEELAAFFDSIKKGAPAPIPFEEIIEVHSTAFDAWEQVKNA